MHSICKKYKGTTARMDALRNWTTYIHANVPQADDSWEKIVLAIDETKLDDETFTQLFIDYCSLGCMDLDEI